MPVEAIQRYLETVEGLNIESARSHRFAQLLQELFGQYPDFIERYTQGIEQVVRVREKDRLLRGRVDNLFGNLIIEFESDLDRTRAQAEGQLRQYTRLLWAQEQGATRTPYLCLATDGVRFAAYTPLLLDDGEVRLQPLETVDFRNLPPDEAYLWLDRILMRRERLTPTSALVTREFGVHSHAYCTLSHRLMQTWRALQQQPQYAVLYNTWERYLRIVYGELAVEPELFIRHSYLATLAKIIAWQRLNPTMSEPSLASELITGKFFEKQGIRGYIEDDFFAWLAREEAQAVGVETIRYLSTLMASYDFSRLTEDVLKSLYQELVDPATRHDLGEYYTPDWLAHRIVQELLEPDATRSLLDPACGSGTFVYFALLEKRRRLGDKPETLTHVLQSVYGIDIHPLAVIIARTNYLLGLGELLTHRMGDFQIPIYLADALRLPEYERSMLLGQPTRRYRVELEDKQVYLPESFLGDPLQYDRLVDSACEFALRMREKDYEPALLRSFLQSRGVEWREVGEEFESFQTLALTLKHFLDEGRDTIWAFVLKNLYKPLLFLERFDAVMGNPPWIAYRSLEPSYQEFVRRLVASEYELVKGRGELITHLEVASLFLVRAADLYLKPDGAIAFVMPRSLFHADQHDGLRRGDYRFAEYPDYTLQLTALWDCEQIAPLFSVPCCVVWGQKRLRTTAPAQATLPARVFTGRLPDKNCPLQEAQAHLSETPATIFLSIRDKRSYWSEHPPAPAGGVSPYRQRFRQGATLVPREFWFLKIQRPPLGINPKEPPFETYAPSQRGKYRLSKNQGQVEAEFLYATLLGEDAFPFGYRNPRIVVLPLWKRDDRYEVLDSEAIFRTTRFKMYDWMELVEKEWTRLRGRKADKMSLRERIDYRRGLSIQNPRARYLVLYPDIQRVSCALVVEPLQVAQEVTQREKGVPIQGFVVDSVFYYYETENADEAYYLAAALNAPEIDRRLGGLRRREQKSHPHVAKKIFDVAPIPLYDASNPLHRRLAELGRQCAMQAQAAMASGAIDPQQNVAQIRRAMRERLHAPLEIIDQLTQQLLAGDGS